MKYTKNESYSKKERKKALFKSKYKGKGLF